MLGWGRGSLRRLVPTGPGCDPQLFDPSGQKVRKGGWCSAQGNFLKFLLGNFKKFPLGVAEPDAVARKSRSSAPATRRFATLRALRALRPGPPFARFYGDRSGPKAQPAPKRYTVSGV